MHSSTASTSPTCTTQQRYSSKQSSQFTIGQIIRQFGQQYIDRYQPDYRKRTVLEHIANCRTPFLGGHQITCTDCGHTVYSWNSCGDSNCPQCQNIKKQLWIDKMTHHLLPLKHFHIIFTIPQELRDWFFYNQRHCYNLLFRVAYQTIQKIAGAGQRGLLAQTSLPVQTAMVATLHTWGSNLSYHPHVHCIVPAGSFQNQQ